MIKLITNNIIKYKLLILLNAFNLGIFQKLHTYATTIPDHIDNIVKLPISHSILQFFGITSTATLSQFTHSLPWVWIVGSVITSVLIQFLKGILKIVVIILLIVIGYLAYTGRI